MTLHLVVLAGLVSAKGGADLPPRPDFAALIPPTSSVFFGPIQTRCDPARFEATALAGYAKRVWDDLAIQDERRDHVVQLLVVIPQLDSALLTLNPNPTAGEAIARIRAYLPVFALARREIKLDDANPKPLLPGRLCPLRSSFHRMNRYIKLMYYPILARTA